LGDGRFETPAGTITTAGRWNLTVTVTRPGLEAAVFNAPVDVGAAQLPTRPSVVSNAPIRAPLTILAVALATALGLGIGVARRHRIGMRRRKSPGHGGPIKTDPVIDRITC
jgi:hypothetical protein